MASNDYVLEKLDAAVLALTLGGPSLPSRLLDASEPLRTLKDEEDLPPHLAVRYQVVRQHLLPPVELEPATYFARLAPNKAQGYAKELVELRDAIRSYVEDR